MLAKMTSGVRPGADAPGPFDGLAWRCLTALLAADVLLIAADLFYRHGTLHDPRWLVTRAHGFGELFQYAKFAAMTLLLMAGWLRRRSTAASIFGLLFLYLLADDAFELHERVGARLAVWLALPAVSALRPAQVGELIYLAALGTTVLGAIVYLLWRGQPHDRRLILTLGAGIGLLAVPGVWVDTLHSFVQQHSWRVALGIVEDGGEMLVTSLLVFLTLARTRHQPLAVGA